MAEKASEAVESALKAAGRITSIVGRALEATGKTYRKQNKKRNKKIKKTGKTPCGGTIGPRPLRGPYPRNKTVQEYQSKCQ